MKELKKHSFSLAAETVRLETEEGWQLSPSVNRTFFSPSPPAKWTVGEPSEYNELDLGIFDWVCRDSDRTDDWVGRGR